MRFFDHRLSLFILLFTLPLLFLPKINLISVDSGETAGLRIDDLVLFFLALLLMWSHTLSHQRMDKIEGWILLLTGFSFLSFFSSRLLSSSQVLYTEAKIFYTVRLLEYFLFFYIGAIASHYFQRHTIIRAFFLWNVFIMLLQKFQITGGVSSEGYYGDVSSRVQGIASFPSEMGLILNLLFCYMVYDPSLSSRLRRFFDTPFSEYFSRKLYLYSLFFLCGMFVIFTGNRISIVALLLCFFCALKQVINFRSAGSFITLMIVIPILLGGVGFFVAQSAGVYDRSLDLFSWKNLDLFSIVWEKIDLTKSPMGNEVVSSENYDASWWIRIHKWLFAAKSYLTHPECYLQGLGPGSMGAALDGGLLRIVTEYGLIGVVLFWKFFACLYRLNQQTKWMVIAFLINMIFFDAYLAYKTMSLLLFSCGYIFECQQRVVRNNPAVA